MTQKPSEQPYRTGERLQARVMDSQRPDIDAYFADKKAGTFEPVTPRYAATVMLVREADKHALARYRSTKPRCSPSGSR